MELRQQALSDIRKKGDTNMFLTCHYFSKVLMHNTEINVVIPTPEGNEQITEAGPTQRYDYENGLPVVYLLHGAYGDNSSWVRFSNIERYAQAHNIVAVMASVENSLYQDMVHGNKYLTFISEELPSFITTLFPVSKKREDTYICGFSMGGYGAWFIGLSCPEKYGKIAGMSAAMDVAGLSDEVQKGNIEAPFPFHDIFEDPAHLAGSDKDIFELYRRDAEKGCVPELYQACGTKDFLYQMNEDANRRLTEMGAKITYSVTPDAMHNWDYWDSELPKILDWMMQK